MLITSLSMPRTGSVWWGEYQKILHPGSIILHEPFNHPFYFLIDKDEKFQVYLEYINGTCWRRPNSETGNIDLCYYKMNISIDEWHKEWIKYIRISKQDIICRNHIIPTSDVSLDFLSTFSDKIFYTYRKNTHEQVASYVIALYTKEFACYKSERSNQDSIFNDSIIDNRILNIIDNFSSDISKSAGIVKRYFPNCEWIDYESMPFENTKNGMPVKQNKSAFDRLASNDKSIILNILEKYGIYSQ